MDHHDLPPGAFPTEAAIVGDPMTSTIDARLFTFKWLDSYKLSELHRQGLGLIAGFENAKTSFDNTRPSDDEEGSIHAQFEAEMASYEERLTQYSQAHPEIDIQAIYTKVAEMVSYQLKQMGYGQNDHELTTGDTAMFLHDYFNDRQRWEQPKPTT